MGAKIVVARNYEQYLGYCRAFGLDPDEAIHMSDQLFGGQVLVMRNQGILPVTKKQVVFLPGARKQKTILKELTKKPKPKRNWRDG